MLVINSVVNMDHVWTGTTILTLVVYWTVGTLYLLLDVFNRPQFLRKYKVQPGTNEPVELHRLGPVINHFFFISISQYFGMRWFMRKDYQSWKMTFPLIFQPLQPTAFEIDNWFNVWISIGFWAGYFQSNMSWHSDTDGRLQGY